MSEEPVKSFNHTEALDKIFKEIYQDRLDYQLKFQARVLGSFPERPPLTRRQKFKKKWKKFWDHIPDFIAYIRSYEYENWRYWDRDGF
jgi:hypothetical protein